MDTKRYFARIGLDADTPVARTEAFLGRVQNQHVLTVPYENLDILGGKPLSLSVDDLYEKIVVHHRGGYCFEVNALLRELLLALGFGVRSYFARYLRGETEIPVRRHHVLVVTADDGEFVVDVGIGQTAPRFPLRLEAGLVQTQGDETYRFERDPALGWVLWELHHGTWQRYFSFTDDEALPHDFIQPSFYCEKHPDSPFNREIMLAIKTPDGRKTLDGRTFKIFRGSALAAIEEEVDNVRLTAILAEHFGITVDPLHRIYS